ncbi:hypothetical protein PSEUBRA_004766 [Kalmanozyma brasiliensis GHG001]|uniref:uncharacterized protein n=1 Tax=Kalmanozyma brasiliensis (strain GHG001) TaxID=1365824 RepID=UPI002867CBF1|nr:uncharacterized protein PSEUBRA_004766 [Kalmanozyma brasiliensis GHG001]KAF6767425.1 hypothetical protein PSEUBRA_004766 [Kalmanozyma brasiliensis GHG001]
MNGANGSRDRIPALPAEVLARIIASLVPAVDPNASTLPHLAGLDFDSTPALPPSPNSDLLAAASSSRLLHDIATRMLYRRPLLRTLKSLNQLAATITSEAAQHIDLSSSSKNGESSHATQIRSIQLPPGDGLLQPGDTLAEQTCYVDSLRTLFQHATRIDYVSLEHRPAGAALLEFLRPSTVCRPRRITLSNLSFSAPPFSTTQSLAPLSKVTHLHLIKIVPPPALISFLVGEQINAEEQGNIPKSLAAGLSPRETLECLRLSLLPADALVDFDAYIAWRRAWKVYEKLSAQQQAREPAPRAPRGPARRFAVQEALYDLAVHSHRLPRLRLFMLELIALSPLIHTDYQAEKPAGRRAAHEDAHTFLDAARSSTDVEAPIPDPNAYERDRYWAQIEDGKLALTKLWADSQEAFSGRVDIRVVAARPNGHDRREGFQDFDCQAQHEPDNLGAISSNGDANGFATTYTDDERPGDAGSWADPDVFSLVRTAPHLSFRALGGSAPGWYWTGELPRQTRHPSPLTLPSIVSGS